jgi:hypothetical protein
MGKANIADRLKTLIDTNADKRGKFAQLEGMTNISSENWKSFYYGRQRPNPDMIEAVAKLWPEHAFWLVTGITDAQRGHIDPYGPPETGTSLDAIYMERRAAARVFRAAIDRAEYIETRLQENPHFEQDDQVVKLESLLVQLRRLRDEEERTMNELEKNGDQEN